MVLLLNSIEWGIVVVIFLIEIIVLNELDQQLRKNELHNMMLIHTRLYLFKIKDQCECVHKQKFVDNEDSNI